MKMPGCLECENTQCLIKKHIHSERLQSFLSHKSMFKCRKGQQFILQGAPVNGLYFIYSGVVKVYRQTAFTDSQIIRFSGNGEIVGHRGFGTNFVYDISAAALEDTVLCYLPTSEMVELLHAVPEVLYDLMLFYAEQLQKSEANAVRFAKMSVREKVINGLLFISEKFGQTNGLINIVMSRKDIGDFAGTSQDQVIRVISALKKEGLIEVSGKAIGIKDKERMLLQLPSAGYFLEG